MPRSHVPPSPTKPMPDDAREVLSDALDNSHKSAEGALEDIKEAFNAIPKEQLEHAAAVCRDLGNEAVKAGRHEEAAEHYTSCLAARPYDHEVLCNRALCYLSLGETIGGERMDEYFELALQDSALAVNVKPDWSKGLYRFGCALQKCKKWKESASVFTKVCELEPDNVEASGRLIQAREMLQMVLNVERVNDPLWMHKPEPEKTPIQKRAEAAQGKNDEAMNALREELGKSEFDFSLLERSITPKERWYADSGLAKGLASHLLAHSAVLAPREQLEALLDEARTDAYAEIVRAAVPTLVPRGQSGVVLHLGSAMGLLPLLSMESGANKVYICEPHGFLAKLAHAGVQRHTLIAFERENWARLPMNVGLSERVKQAGSIAFRGGQYERAISLYTEALPPTDSKPDLKVSLPASHALSRGSGRAPRVVASARLCPSSLAPCGLCSRRSTCSPTAPCATSSWASTRRRSPTAPRPRAACLTSERATIAWLRRSSSSAVSTRQGCVCRWRLPEHPLSTPWVTPCAGEPLGIPWVTH